MVILIIKPLRKQLILVRCTTSVEAGMSFGIKVQQAAFFRTSMSS